MIPVSFPNLRGAKSPSEVLKPIADGVTDYYLKVSGGRVRFVWRVPAEFLPMPNPIEHYGLGLRNNGFPYVQEVLTATDDALDFTGADFVLVLHPETATHAQIAISPAQQMTKQFKFRTREGDIFRSTYTSSMTIGSAGWIIIAHEFAHGLGLPDTYSYENNSQFMGSFDLMGTYSAIELTAWHKWQLGFIDDSQVHCLRPDTDAQLWISHVSADSKRPEMIVIPTSAITATVIEARRKERFDLRANFTRISDGLLVYEVNTAYATGKGPLRAISKPGFAPGGLDGLVGLNEQLQAGRYVISSSEVGTWGHVVRIRQS